MSKKNENDTNYLIKKWYSDITKLSMNEMKEFLGLDCENDYYEIGNLSLSKDKSLISRMNPLKKDIYYDIAVLDDSRDLKNNLVIKNKDFVSLVTTRFQSKSPKLTEAEIKKYFINDGLEEIIINHNLLLTTSNSENEYIIELLDDSKDADGKIHNDSIDLAEVKDHILSIKVPKTKYDYECENEVTLNSYLYEEIKKIYKSVKKSSGHNTHYFDLEIGVNSKNSIVIEIKLAKNLKKMGEMQRALGQVIDYKYDKPAYFILLVVGLKEEKGDDCNIYRLQTHISKIKNCELLYKEIK